MIQFNIGGQYLELPADFDLQFTKSNPIFAYKDIECGRSTSFSIDLTPANMSILKLDYDPHTVGTLMRTSVAAQMQIGVVVYDGFIRFTEYDEEKRQIQCLFVFGDIIALYAISQQGKIADYYQSRYSTNWNGVYIIQQGSLWNTWVYAQGEDTALDAAHSKPSINLYLLAQNVGNVFGVAVTTDCDMVKNLQYVPDKLYKSDGTEAVFGNVVSMDKSLPDMTLAELLKMIAYASGCFLDINGNTITIERGDVSTWNRSEISNVLQKGKCVRTFADYAQFSRVSGVWTSIYSSNVSARTLYGYTINNENIEQETELYEMPVPIPREIVRVETKYMAWLSGEDTAWLTVKNTTNKTLDIFQKEDGSAGIPANELITSLCEQSTTCDITVLMSIIEYEQLRHKSLLWYDGCLWVWTDIEYSKGQAKITMAKIQ